MKKIIYISLLNLSDRVKADWYINNFQSLGCDIEYWNISRLFTNNTIPNKNSEIEKIIININDLDILISQNVNASFVIIVNQIPLFFPLFRILKKYKCYTIFFLWGLLPLNFINSKQKLNLKYFFQRVKSFFITKLYLKLKLINPFDIAFCAGDVAMNSNINAIKRIPLNFVDYENFFYNKENFSFSEIRNEYAVFCDINFPYQSDIKINNYEYLDPEIYFNTLDRYFTHIEKVHNIQIVFALHPKSNYSNVQLKNRVAYKFKTAELIKNSKFVLTHHSTSISFAVLGYKPIIFFSTNEINNIYANNILKYMESMSSYLKQPLINISEENAFQNNLVLKIDKNLYEKYKYAYLTSADTEMKSNFSIISSYILF